MDEITRTYRFEMTVSVEPGHTAYPDPEWAADAAASALTDGYGLDAFYDNVELLGAEQRAPMTDAERAQLPRSYRFSVTFEVDPRHVAYGDPVWAADAAHGALSNDYGIECEYAIHHAVRAE
mgnify:CR=1 FL=1